MEFHKVCPSCGYEWHDRDEFVADENVAIIGYQPNFEYLEAGLFLFNHVCNTTFALEVEHFADLYDGPIFEDHMTGCEGCPGYCLQQDNLNVCHARCECAYVREIIQIIKNKGKV